MEEKVKIEPQPGPQTQFLSSAADIVIFGGSAGGGKTYALLLEPTRNIHNKGFNAVIFRRQQVEIGKPGGLWDESQNIYPAIGGIGREGYKDYRFPSGARLGFSHLEQEKDKLSWQGSALPFIGFEELTHFTKTQFFYMFSRNRSNCGVRPYIRATTNPDAESWVAELIAWWIDPNTGLAIPERSGVIRYFIRHGEELLWGETPDELMQRYPGTDRIDIKSLTFIRSTVYDNKILMEKNPEYLANLKAMNKLDRGRLLDGNWKIKASAGLFFKREYFEIVDAIPSPDEVVRTWDFAATVFDGNNNPDYTVGLKMARANGMFFVEDVRRDRLAPNGVERLLTVTASQDGMSVPIKFPQDPGQAGKAQVTYLTSKLAGYQVITERETGDKVTRASAASSQAEAGNIKLLRGDWNEAFITELTNFPPSGEGHDDQVDALSTAINYLAQPSEGQGYIDYYRQLAGLDPTPTNP